ncbi:MAG: glutamate--tRNA ligase [Blastocatellia bacterium]
MTNVRVRFAPSPTGYLHVGGARTALFNWLFARQMRGVFVLRIEDTDTLRNDEAMVRGILEGMEWLGLDYDEGPFFQSDNYAKHRAAASQLLESGHAYRDFTPKAERDDATIKQRVAEAAARQDRPVNPYRNLSRAESDARAATGEPFVIRFKVPEEGRTQFEDEVFGTQERDFKDIEDLVLLRSDGHPLYNLSVVCDDIEMGITHVIRGQDHLSNTHKQVLLYQALGQPVPKFAHLPLIMAPDKGKLSKRKHGAIVSVTTYRDAGFIPDAFLNFLALLGWSPDSATYADQEIFTRADLVKIFSLGGIHKANAVFNFTQGDERNWTDQKALWMNWEYIKTLPLETLLPMVKAELQSSELWRDEYEGEQRAWFEHVLTLLRERARTLKDFTNHGRPYFVDDVSFDFDEAAVKKNLQKDAALKELLPQLADAFNGLEDFTHDGIEALLRKIAEEKGVKVGLLTNATRTALTGQSVGPGLFSVVEVIGKKRTVVRLQHAIQLL